MIYVHHWFTVDLKLGVRPAHYVTVIEDTANEKEIKLLCTIEVLDSMIFKISLPAYWKALDAWL